MAAANNFFNVDAGQPPMRVAGPPFDSATSLVAGTPANTVTWYTGEMGTDPARGTAVRQGGRLPDCRLWRARQRAGDPLDDREYRGLRGQYLFGERSERRGSV